MWVLIPVKKFDDAKSRLSSVLSPEERRSLCEAMLNDLLSVISCHPLVEGLLLVSSEPSAVLLAQKYGAEVLSDSDLGISGLNSAVHAGVSALGKRKINEVMVIHGDIPLVSAKELTNLIHAHRKARKPAVTIVPDRRNEGSNCLVCSSAAGIKFHYGADSLRKHSEEALAIGASLQVLPLPGVGFDVDYSEDLVFLGTQAGSTQALRTRRYLKGSGIMKRLASYPKPQVQRDIPQFTSLLQVG